MAGPLAAPIQVTPAQQAVLLALVRRPTCPQGLALRARLLLGAAAQRAPGPGARLHPEDRAQVARPLGRRHGPVGGGGR